MNKFNGLLNGDDVLIVVYIDVINDSGKRGGLPRACRACDENESSTDISEFLNYLWNT